MWRQILRRLNRRRNRAIVSLFAGIASWAIPVLLGLPSVQAIGPISALFWIGLVSTATTIMLEFLPEFEDRENSYTAIMDIALRTIVPDPRDKFARACVFVPNSDDELYIFAHSSALKTDELELKFTRANQGIVGHVFWVKEDHEPETVNLNNISDQDKVTVWKLSSEQLQLTSEVMYVIAVPIRKDKSSPLLGILAIDSLDSRSISNLDMPGVVDSATEMVGLLIEALSLENLNHS